LDALNFLLVLCVGMYVCVCVDSELNNLSARSLVYPNHSIEEPFRCLPTSSIIIQVREKQSRNIGGVREVVLYLLAVV